MAEREDRRTRMTKRMLKDSLLELLKTVGIHDISIRELCDLADVNRSTFYKYYGSQYALLSEMEDDWLQSIENSIDAVKGIDQVQFVQVLSFVNDNIELSRLLVNSNVDPEFPQKLFALPSVKRLIDENLQTGEQNEAAEYFYTCYINGGYSVIKHWLNKANRESPENMARIMTHVYSRIGMREGN